MDRAIPQNCLVGDDNAGNVPYYPDSHSYRPEGKQEVRLRMKLDSVLLAYNLSKVDWIKVDTGGSEPEVLLGALRTIELYRPKILLGHHIGFRPGVDGMAKGILAPYDSVFLKSFLNSMIIVIYLGAFLAI